jgi:hypothetical protein
VACLKQPTLLRSFFWFFGGAAFAKEITSPVWQLRPRSTPRQFSGSRAAEKQKEKMRFAFCPINRPPVAGFVAQTSSS